MPQTRFCFDFNGKRRVILRCHLKKNGRVILNPRQARFSRPEPAANFSDSEITETHLSIHPPNSNGHLLHFTQDTTKAKKAREGYQFTNAILAKRFAPVLVAYVADLSGGDYDEGAREDDIVLGSLKTNFATLFYCIFLGAASQEFIREDPLSDTTVHEALVGEIRLVLPWSFFTVPSHNTGAGLLLETTKYTEGLSQEQIDWMNGLKAGMTAHDAMAWWSVYRDLLANYAKRLWANEADYNADLTRLWTAQFVKSGTPVIHR